MHIDPNGLLLHSTLDAKPARPPNQVDFARAVGAAPSKLQVIAWLPVSASHISRHRTFERRNIPAPLPALFS
jgi:hypothetical protein